MSLSSILPKVKPTLTSNKWLDDDEDVVVKPVVKQHKKSLIPAYPHRTNCGFIPTTPTHFQDGGSYPEIQVVQYPLEMGKGIKGTSQLETLPLTIDQDGSIKYEMVLHSREREGKIVHARMDDMIAQDVEDLARPSEEEVLDTTAKTREALEKLVSGKAV
jgi:SNW domain-containing protein 1